MALFGIGSTLSSASTDAAPRSSASAHPSAPIPVQGPPVGQGVRVALGESGVEVFPLILGGAEFGWNVDLESSHEILDTYVELGGNAVHTADSFSGGRSEHIIGQWLRSRGLRDEVVLAVRVGGHPDNPGLGPVNLVRAVEASLTRLGTDRLDVAYLDATADSVTALEDTLATAEWLVESGKVQGARRRAATPPRSWSRRASSPRRASRGSRCSTCRSTCSAATSSTRTCDSSPVRRAWRSRPRTRSSTASSPAVTAPARGAASRCAARSSRRTCNRRGSRTLRALDAVGTELGVPDAAVAVAWLLAQKLVTAPIVNAYARSAGRRARAGRGRAAQPCAPRRHRTRRRVTSRPATSGQ